MIQEQKVLIGRMDKENSPETMNLYDYLDAHNIRTVGNDESDGNYVSNLEGNVRVSTSIPIGQSRCIGSNSFEIVSKAYFVRYNSMGYHQIVEFDYDTSNEFVIFENLTDSGDVDILNLTANDFFNDIRLMHEKFLILNNGKDYPLFLNVEYFKKNKGTKTYTNEDLILIKQPPLGVVNSMYLSNVDRASNMLKGNLFQFRYNYEYEDSRTSSWSDVSKREVPINEPSQGNGQSVSSSNVMLLSLKIDNTNVEKVNLGVRIGNGNWLLVQTIVIDDLVNLPNTSIPFDEDTGTLTDTEVTEAYDPNTGIYQTIFYNDGLYPILDQVEIENPYDAIPLKAETLEVINGNIIALGGITSGYDRPILNSSDEEPVGVEVSYYDSNITNTIISNPNFDISRVEYSTEKNLLGRVNLERWRIKFNNIAPKEEDTIILQLQKDGSPTIHTMMYAVSSADASAGKAITIQNAVNSFQGQLPDSTTSISYVNNEGGYMTFRAEGTSGRYKLIARYVEYGTLGDFSTQSLNTLKNGATYQVAIEYRNKFGQYFPIVTDNRFVARTDSLAKTQGLLPEINWQLPLEAPEGADSYSILLSENQNYLNYITLTGVIKTTSGDSNYLVFDLKSLKRFAQFEKESQITYSFTKGDKVTFIKTINEDGATVRWFRYHFIELEIVDFTIEANEADPSDVKYLLKVRNTPLLATYNLDNTVEVEMEIYTPRPKAINEESTLFYSIGETYPIVNGEHSVTSGIIKTGDSYFRGRNFRSSLVGNKAVLLTVADPNFSDNYESKLWSAGRARTYNDEIGRVEQKGSIRYSDEYVVGSKYNGVNRFYLERIYGEQGGQTTSKYGWIRKLQMRGSDLVCIQEFKVGLVPVYKTIVSDQADNTLIADSGKIFGHVRYRIGNYGCGDAKESIVISKDDVIYFFDDNSCVPLRDSYSGLDVIDINMSSYFIKYTKQAKSKGAKFIGVYDNINKEYNLTIEDVSGRLITLTFDGATFQDRLIGTPTIEVVSATNGTATLSGTDLTYTPNNNYVGNAEVTLLINGTTTKKVNLNIVAGDSTPSQFYFTERNDVLKNTVITSNTVIISDINMRSNISIVGGEYRINGGAWTSTASTVVNGDSVQVRHTSSTSDSTTVTTTLTVGSYSTQFRSTTTDNSVAGEVWVSGRAYVGGGTIKIDVDTTHELSLPVYVLAEITYQMFDSPAIDVVSVELEVTESTTVNETGIPLTNNSDITQVRLNTSTSSPADGSVVLCEDGFNRILRIDRNVVIAL